MVSWNPNHFQDDAAFEANVDRLHTQYTGIQGAIKGIDGELTGKILRVLPKASGNVRDFGVLDRSSGRFDQTKYDKVQELIRDNLSVSHDLSPLKNAYNAGRADDLTNQMVNDVYFSHAEELVSVLGRSNFSGNMDSVMHRHDGSIQRNLQRAAVSGYDPDAQGTAAVPILKQHFHADPAHIDDNVLQREASNALLQAVIGNNSTQTLYDIAYKN